MTTGPGASARGLRWAFLAYAVALLVAAWLLPGTVPLHFSGSGAADRYGSRAQALLLFTGLGLGLAVLAAGLREALGRVGLDLVDVPHGAYWKTPEREPELRRRLRADLDQLVSATVLLCTVVVGATTWVARRAGEDRLPWLFFVAFAAYLAWVAWWVWQLVTRRYRPPG